MTNGHAPFCPRSIVSSDNVQVQDKLHTTHSTLPLPQIDSKIVPPEQRRNPRRSQGNQLQTPPRLVRQEERKASFVDCLVDSAAQMVEVIWPSSVAHCKPQSGGGLSLRRYIEETLRRSRTSYSTLQVALYYLVLIMPWVPSVNLVAQQTADSPSHRALQCGRRMFLAALILASKYLQDRNYSAKAWSKMSGLRVAEINLNERVFLEAVNWKLHIPDHLFKRWTEVVLRYTPGQFPPPAGQNLLSGQQACWKSIIPQLTPDLEKVAPTAVETVACARSETVACARSQTVARPRSEIVACARSQSSVATFSSLPSFLEPHPVVRPDTPVLGVGYLPTPRLTPLPVSTPAVSVGSVESCYLVGKLSRRSSFGSQISSVLSPNSNLSESSRLSPASSVTSISSSGSYSQESVVKVPAEKSNTACSAWQARSTAYDAQPQASRRVKRSQEEISEASEEEATRAVHKILRRVVSEVERTKAQPINVEDEDEDRLIEDMATEYAFLDTKIPRGGNGGKGDDRKRRRMSYGSSEA